MRSNREERRVGKQFVVTNTRRCHCRCTQNLPRRSNPLAGRSIRRRAGGHSETLSFCTCVCSKGKADPDQGPTSELPTALPSPPNNKSPHPKGRAGPEILTISKLPGALPPPQQNKSCDPKGTAEIEILTISTPPNALPSPPQYKYAHPKGMAEIEILTTSKLQNALPAPQKNKPKCSTGTRIAEATAKLPNALPRPLF